jgi:hypothetical protein
MRALQQPQRCGGSVITAARAPAPGTAMRRWPCRCQAPQQQQQQAAQQQQQQPAARGGQQPALAAAAALLCGLALQLAPGPSWAAVLPPDFQAYAGGGGLQLQQLQQQQRPLGGGPDYLTMQERYRASPAPPQLQQQRQRVPVKEQAADALAGLQAAR